MNSFDVTKFHLRVKIPQEKERNWETTKIYLE